MSFDMEPWLTHGEKKRHGKSISVENNGNNVKLDRLRFSLCCAVVGRKSFLWIARCLSSKIFVFEDFVSFTSGDLKCRSCRGLVGYNVS